MGPTCGYENNLTNSIENMCDCSMVENSAISFMGYSMRVDATDGHSYRYTEWPAWDGDSLAPVWEHVHAVELYNHSAPCPAGTIFDCFENENLAKAAPPQLLRELGAGLRAAFGS